MTVFGTHEDHDDGIASSRMRNPLAPASIGRFPRAEPAATPMRPGPGLSALAVSPFAMPNRLLHGEVWVAWVGRCSTEDRQDPRQSLLRQLERSKTALPEAWVIVCHFYDVESGRMELGARGQKTGYERFDIP